jgi:hypothetical protein
MRQSDSFQRWQKIQIDQHGVVINLILTLSTAAQGFIFTQIIANSIKYEGSGWLWASGLMFLIASFMGVLCSIKSIVGFSTHGPNS